MNITELKPGEALKIWCRSYKSDYVAGYPKSTFICWVTELVAEGQIIRFTDYTNYEDDWTVIKVECTEKISELEKRYGDQKYYLKHIEGNDEVVEQSHTQTSVI